MHAELKLPDVIDSSWYYSFQYQKEPSTYYLPFIPGYDNSGNFDNMAISLNATHPGLGQFTEYNVHNLFGHMMAMYTQYFLGSANYFENWNNRPFVLSRSTFAGSGQYASHWLGDNWRSWDYLRYSIAGIMNMNMFGVPHVGADVCGFFGNNTVGPNGEDVGTFDDFQELCARWIQVAAFYPLARVHQNLTFNGDPNTINSEPYNLKGNYLQVAKDSMHLRYEYLRHQYTCLYEVSTWGGSCIDPLFYYYPEDNNTFVDIESSFMVGGTLKISPVLQAGVGMFATPAVATHTSYFPAGTWLNMHNMAEVIESKGANYETSDDTRPSVHLREGKLVAV